MEPTPLLPPETAVAVISPEPPENPPTRLVLLVGDPQWLHAYWELSPADRQRHRLGEADNGPIPILRLFDCSETVSPHRPRRSLDVTLSSGATRWNVAVPPGVSRWQGELGYIGPRGTFVSLCQSNAVRMPTPPRVGEEAGVEPVTAAEGPLTRSGQEQTAERPLQMQPAGSHVLQLQLPPQPALPSSAEAGALGGASEQVGPAPSYASEQWMAPPTISSEQMAAPQAAPAPQAPPAEAGRAKPFWLQVQTELIVYGATEPDARVTVMGEPIRLRPDGTFSLRFALPDGTWLIPVHAVNADGDQERLITPVVQKRTD